MIPKIIHYCWLSGEPYPEKIKRCIDSWKKYLQDYELRLWTADSFEINEIPWTKEAFELKQYAFVSDYVRFFALYNYGGIYLDSDVEILKSFDSLLHHSFFFGYEYTALPEAACVGSEKYSTWIKACLNWYREKNFVNSDKSLNRIIAPLIMKQGFETIERYKLIDDGEIHEINGGLICPFDYFSVKNGFNGKVSPTENSFSVHHFNSAWLKNSFTVKIKKMLHIFLINILGKIKYNKYIYKIRLKKTL